VVNGRLLHPVQPDPSLADGGGSGAGAGGGGSGSGAGDGAALLFEDHGSIRALDDDFVTFWSSLDVLNETADETADEAAMAWCDLCGDEDGDLNNPAEASGSEREVASSAEAAALCEQPAPSSGAAVALGSEQQAPFAAAARGSDQQPPSSDPAGAAAPESAKCPPSSAVEARERERERSRGRMISLFFRGAITPSKGRLIGFRCATACRMGFRARPPAYRHPPTQTGAAHSRYFRPNAP